MIPVLASMIALYICFQCVEAMYNRERHDSNDFTFADLVALVAMVGALAGAAWIWGISASTSAEIERAERQMERLLR